MIKYDLFVSLYWADCDSLISFIVAVSQENVHLLFNAG